MPKTINTTSNGQKQLLWRIIALAMMIIVGLIGTVWGVTWVQSKKQIEKNQESITEIVKFMAAQEQINKNLDKFMGDQHEMSLKILEKVSD